MIKTEHKKIVEDDYDVNVDRNCFSNTKFQKLNVYCRKYIRFVVIVWLPPEREREFAKKTKK